MAVYENSRYVNATENTLVTVDEITGEFTDPETYLLDDRRQFNPDDYDSNIIVIPRRGETVDMLANRLYDDSTLYWIICDFNDSIAFDTFRTFNGTEQLVVPSPEIVFNEILNAEPEEF